MVASFRDSVTHWHDVVLPADLYMRAATSGASGAPGDTAAFGPALDQAIAHLPGVSRVGTVRARPVSLVSAQPPVTLLARSFQEDPSQVMPLVGDALQVPPGHIGIYVSEAMVDLYGARPGSVFAPLSVAFQRGAGPPPVFFVAGVWRDYVRQFGSIRARRARLLAADRRPHRERRVAVAGTGRCGGAGAAGHPLARLATAGRAATRSSSRRWPSCAPPRCASSTAALP